MAKQRTFFIEKKVEIEAARRILLQATKQEVVVEAQEDSAKEARVDVPSKTEQEMDGNEEKAATFEEARVDVPNETEAEMDPNEEKTANSEESRVDIQNEVKEKMDGKEESESNAEEAKLDVQNETMDDDVSRKDNFYDTKADDDTASVQLLLSIGVIIGLAVTWYLSKLQRKQQSGLHKKLDVAVVYRPACIELSYC
jgi:hypothetical protein